MNLEFLVFLFGILSVLNAEEVFLFEGVEIFNQLFGFFEKHFFIVKDLFDLFTSLMKEVLFTILDDRIEHFFKLFFILFGISISS